MVNNSKGKSKQSKPLQQVTKDVVIPVVSESFTSEDNPTRTVVDSDEELPPVVEGSDVIESLQSINTGRKSDGRNMEIPKGSNVSIKPVDGPIRIINDDSGIQVTNRLRVVTENVSDNTTTRGRGGRGRGRGRGGRGVNQKNVIKEVKSVTVNLDDNTSTKIDVVHDVTCAVPDKEASNKRVRVTTKKTTYAKLGTNKNSITSETAAKIIAESKSEELSLFKSLDDVKARKDGELRTDHRMRTKLIDKIYAIKGDKDVNLTTVDSVSGAIMQNHRYGAKFDDNLDDIITNMLSAL